MDFPKNLNTNIKRVEFLMDHSPLGNAFVIEAIARYAAIVIKDKEKIIESMKDNPLLNPQAWVRAAEDAQDMINQFYGPTPKK